MPIKSPLSASPFVTALGPSGSSQCPIPTLLGKSNFSTWHLAILLALRGNTQAEALIFGTWTETHSPLPQDTLPNPSASSATSTTSVALSPEEHLSKSRLYNIVHAPSLSHAAFSFHQAVQHDYEMANLKVCRFIRSTLAMNVVPFVRQHTNAKSLFEQLVYLYGEKAGIDMVGGPTIFGKLDMALQGQRLEKPAATDIAKFTKENVAILAPSTSVSATRKQNDEESLLDDELHLLTVPERDRRMTSESELGFGINVERQVSAARSTVMGISPAESSIPPEKKKVAFNLGHLSRHPSHDDASISSLDPDPAKSLHTRKTSTWDSSFALTDWKGSATSATSTTSFRDFDFSYTPARKASTAEDEGTEVEMKSLMLRAGQETPTPSEGGLTPMAERSSWLG